MPMFEYKCKSCGKKFDFLVLRNDVEVTCEHCGGTQVVKLLSTFAVHHGRSQAVPTCAEGCASGFDRGACGSGMCSGHAH